MLRTPNTIAAHRLIRWAGEPIVEPLFQAYFQDGKDIGDHATLAAIAATLGLDATEFLASGEFDAEVRAEDAHFRRIGINGVPSFALDGQVMFSGAYPAEHMAQIFGRRAA
jgi:predicted DsbA family dithiol-disulfide isomerase